MRQLRLREPKAQPKVRQLSDKIKLDLYQETKLASKQSKAEFSFSSKILSLQHHSLRLWVENPEA